MKTQHTPDSPETTKFRKEQTYHGQIDTQVLLEALRNGESSAIELLFEKITRQAYSIARKAGLPAQDIEEALNDTVIIFLNKIKAGQYQPNEAPIFAYAFGICKNVINNYAAKNYRRRATITLLDFAAAAENLEEIEYYFTQKEDLETLTQMLKQLDTKQRQVITLKWLDGYCDEEVIALKLTTYTTVDSLKNRRKEAMQKLVALFQK